MKTSPSFPRFSLNIQTDLSRLESLAFPFALRNKIRLSDDVSGPKVGSVICVNVDVALHRCCRHLCICFSVRDVKLIPLAVATRDNCQSGFRVQRCFVLSVCFWFFFFAMLSLSEICHWCCWDQAAVEQCASWCGLCHICLACSCLKGLQACQFCCRGHFSNVTSHTL